MEQEIINKDKVALQETGRVLDLIRRFISNGDAGTKALEMINVGILAYDHDLTISYANDALCILTGREKEDLVGVSVMDVFGETGEEDYTGKVLAEHRAGKSYQYEINTIGKGGKATLLGSGTPLLDERGTFDGGIVFYIDISERKAIEREFRGLKYFNESIVENIPSGIIVLNTDLRVIFANRTFLKLTGLSRPDTIGEYISDVLPFSLLREKRLLLQILEVLDKGGLRSINDIKYTHGGEERIVHAKIHGLADKEHKRMQILVLLDDVTAIHNLQQQLATAQRMDSLGRLAGGIAHDFNNLLGGIMGYASVLKKTVEAKSEQSQHIDMILKATERGACLTHQLLAMASGKETASRMFDPKQVVEELVRILSRTIDKSIVIVKRIDPRTASVTGNETNFQRALLNICLNARDAMPDGGKLTIETENVFLDEDFCMQYIDTTPGDYVLIMISDSGTGIDPSLKPKIFDPFFTTKEEGKGTGLGLSLVYTTINSMGGIIRLKSEAGEGTTFLIYLPTHHKGEGPEGDQAEFLVEGGSETVLIVDDEEIMQALACEILESAGYGTLVAPDGTSALKMFKEKRDGIDIVIIDLIMPNLGGMETFLRIREIDPSIPILISTGFSPYGHVGEILKHDRTGYLQKPFYADEILEKVRTILDST